MFLKSKFFKISTTMKKMDKIFVSLQLLKQNCNFAVLSLRYRYFHCKCSHALHSSLQTFTSMSHPATSTDLKQTHIHCIIFVMRKLHLEMHTPCELLIFGSNSLNSTISSKFNRYISSLSPSIFTLFYRLLRSWHN